MHVREEGLEDGWLAWQGPHEDAPLPVHPTSHDLVWFLSCTD